MTASDRPRAPSSSSPSCPDRPGIVHAVTGLPGRARRQHRGEPAVRRPRRAAGSSCGCSSTARRRRPRSSRCARRSPRWPSAFGMTWELLGGRRAVPDADPGLEVRPLPQRPAVPLEQRARCRSTSPASCPTTATASRWPRRTACRSTTSRSTPETKAEAEATAARRSSTTLDVDLVVLARYMQVLSDETCRRAGGPGDQHPPLVPAELQGRPALPPGATTAA